MSNLAIVRNKSDQGGDTQSSDGTCDFRAVSKSRGLDASDRTLIDPISSPLLAQLIHFPDQEIQGCKGDLYVAPDMLIDNQQFREGLGVANGPPAACYTEAIFNICFLRAWQELGLSRAFKEEKKIVVVSAHGGNWLDGIWRYKVTDECRPMVRELLSEIENLNYDLIYLHICNPCSDTLSPSNTPVIQYMTLSGGEMIHIRRNPQITQDPC